LISAFLIDFTIRFDNCTITSENKCPWNEDQESLKVTGNSTNK